MEIKVIMVGVIAVVVAPNSIPQSCRRGTPVHVEVECKKVIKC
jgi:hypothetical protein